MLQLWGHVSSLGWVALKAALLLLTAVAGFRISGRRTLAEFSVFDFAAAVAVGAIIGRVPNSSATSYLQGAVTIASILVTHNVLTRLRYLPAASRLLDHEPRLLVVDGTVQSKQLRRSGLTDDDLEELLRTRGLRDLSEARLVVFERSGAITVVAQPLGRGGDLIEPLLRSHSSDAA